MNEKFKVVFIDDNMTEKEPFVQNIRKRYPDADCLNVFRNPDEGLNFVLNNLDKKMIVFIDWGFSGYKKNGVDILKSIREKTSLLYVVIMSANQLGSNIPSEDIVYMMNDENFFYLSRSNSDFDATADIIEKIKVRWETKFDCILEQWLLRHPEDNGKEAYRVLGGGKSYTWADILRELRLQSEVGKSFEGMILEFYIYQLNRIKK
jgi:hypothetical protein